MDAQAFLDNFAKVADAPGGVQRLRALVLDLAVRGRLVEHDQAEGQSQELLAAIANQRALALSEVRKAGQTLIDVAPTFPTPSGWAWASMRDLHTKMGAGSTPRGGQKSYVDSGVVFLRSQNVWNDGLRLDAVARIPLETHRRMAGTAVQSGDVLLNITGASIGRACVVPGDFDEEANVSQHVAILRQVDGRMSRWIQIFLISPHGFGEIMAGQVGISREGLSMRRLGLFAVPVPPPGEQARIVTKVDELMALCDELESRQAHLSSVTARFRGTALRALTEAEDPSDLRRAFERVNSNWGALLDHPDSPSEIESAVLHLAVHGRLSSPEAGWRVATVRSDDSGGLPNLPEGWAWRRLEELVDPDRSISYGVIKLGPDPDSGGVAVLRCSDVRRMRIDTRNIRSIEADLSAQYGRTILQGGELLVNVRGTLGGCAVVPFEMAGYNVAREVAVVPAVGIDPAYLLYVFASPTFLSYTSDSLRGTAYQGLNLSLLRAFPVPVPPPDEQGEIVKRVRNLLSCCDRLRSSLALRERVGSGLAASVSHSSQTWLEPGIRAS